MPPSHKPHKLTAGATVRPSDETLARSFFVVSSYLSTATVLYKNGGFTDDEITALRDHTRAMSFDEIYYPGLAADTSREDTLLANYRTQLFSSTAAPGKAGADPEPEPDLADDPGAPLPATGLGRLAWNHLLFGGWDRFSSNYLYDVRALTNDRPYFAAYIKPQDLPEIANRLELVQDEWGYLLLWATLAIAVATASVLIVIPVAFGWRSLFGASRGKGLTIVYFACLGLGYIMVEVGMIAEFVLPSAMRRSPPRS